MIEAKLSKTSSYLDIWLAMNMKGHIGLNLIIMSLLGYLLNIKSYYFIQLLILSTALATLPDIDLRLEIPHRKYTHNIGFALVTSIAVGYVTMRFLGDFIIGFAVILIAMTSHILGDLMTYQAFAPLAPFVNRKMSLKLFRSSNRIINDSILFLGIIIFSLYLIRFYVRFS
jgi:membrane-bound metal-dependent hydrolase YbcI (DUF457 family)